MAVTVDEIAARVRRDVVRRARSSEARAAALRAALPGAAALLRREGATRVWLFGSLASGRAGPASDVDLAAEGLPRRRYFDVLVQLADLVGSDVDLVSWESAPESLRHRILAEGEPL